MGGEEEARRHLYGPQPERRENTRIFGVHGCLPAFLSVVISRYYWCFIIGASGRRRGNFPASAAQAQSLVWLMVVNALRTPKCRMSGARHAARRVNHAGDEGSHEAWRQDTYA